MLKEAMLLAENPADKKLILAAIANIPTYDALSYVSPLLDDQDIKSETEITIFKIIRGLEDRSGDIVLPVLQKIQGQTQNKELKKKVSNMLHYLEASTE